VGNTRIAEVNGGRVVRDSVRLVGIEDVDDVRLKLFQGCANASSRWSMTSSFRARNAAS
jgi:hypothetical protein